MTFPITGATITITIANNYLTGLDSNGNGYTNAQCLEEIEHALTEGIELFYV